MGRPSKADRLFNPNGRRHFRKNYDLRELPVGLLILVGLTAVGGWVIYKGAHPDPGLLALDVVPTGEKDGQQGGDAAPTEDRGPLPADLSVDGWAEGTARSYDPDNLYVKINGRAGYYRSFGVQKLFCLTLQKADDPTTVVDLEMYDHGNVENALGAYNGERGTDQEPEVLSRGLTHYARNALYLTLGRYYLRAVGSDETPLILAQLKKIRSRFEEALEGAPLPWSYGLFIGKMGFKAGALTYFANNAFNFGFANGVNVVRLDDETELFAELAADAATARAQAQRYLEGFRGYGSEVEPGWVQDQYIQTIATAEAQERWVIGVRGAPDLPAAKAGLARLTEGLQGFDVPEGAAAASPPAPKVTEPNPAEAGDSYEEKEGGEDYGRAEETEQ
ncbi:MAG: DUF6599 family protein [Myxococcota bacterium]